MIRTILVPLDGSPLAERALSPACRVSRETGAELVLVRAAPYVEQAQGSPSPLRVTVREAGAYIRAVRDRLIGEGYPAHGVALHSAPLRAIEWTARRRHTDLIVMSTHGRTGLRHLMLGSVAEEVLKDPPAPVLLVRATEEDAPAPDGARYTILVPLDGTAYAEGALPYLARAGLARTSEIILLRAIPSGVPGTTVADDPAIRRMMTSWAEATEGEMHEARAYLDQLARRYLPGAQYRLQAETADPAQAIETLAATGLVDLVVLASQGRTGIDRILHGSVARHVLRHTGVPILVLRPVDVEQLALPATGDAPPIPQHTPHGAAV